MKLLLVDDHALLLDTMSSYLQGAGSFEVFTSSGLEEALSLMAELDSVDLVVMDHSMEGMDGTKGLEAVMKQAGGRPVAIMSGVASKTDIKQAMEAGAAGFLPKTISGRSLVAALQFMGAGERFLPADLDLRETQAVYQAGPSGGLTAREIDVLRGLCAGWSNKEIARELGLQEPTIKLHVQTACRKLGARNRTLAAIMAKEKGIC